MLTFTNLHKAYAATVAVEDLSLRVEPGEILGLLGPGGAGKSTTVHLAFGLLPPDSGTVSVDGLGPPTDSRVRRHLGLAPQALALYADLTGEGNLRFLGRVNGLTGRALDARVEWALDFAGVTDRRHDLVGAYSGGTQRRLNLAAALLHQPQVLLLDEPAAEVDPRSRDAILERVLELKRGGLTVLYATQSVEDAERLCDRVAILDHGRVLALDSVPRLLRAHGAAPTRPKAEARAAETDVARADLAQVFTSLTGRRMQDA